MVSSIEIPRVFSSRSSMVMFLVLALVKIFFASTLETVKVSKKFPSVTSSPAEASVFASECALVSTSVAIAFSLAGP